MGYIAENLQTLDQALSPVELASNRLTLGLMFWNCSANPHLLGLWLDGEQLSRSRARPEHVGREQAGRIFQSPARELPNHLFCQSEPFKEFAQSQLKMKSPLVQNN